MLPYPGDPETYPYDPYRNDPYRGHGRPRNISNTTNANYRFRYPEDAARAYAHGPPPEIHVHNNQFQDNLDYNRPVVGSPPFIPLPMMYERSRSRSRSYSRTEEEAIIAEYQRRKEREAEEKRLAIEKFQHDEEMKKKAAKAAEEAAVAKWHKEKENKLLEEKEAELRLQRKIEEAKAKKKLEDAEYEERVRKDLARFGFRENQVRAIVEHKKPGEKILVLPNNETAILAPPPIRDRQPVYPKIKRKYVSKESLAYYDLPWEYTSDSHEYIIILREMSERETDILFEHTRRLRSHTTLAVEPVRGREGIQNQWVRRRSKSKSGRSHSRGKSPGQIRLAEAVAKRI